MSKILNYRDFKKIINENKAKFKKLYINKELTARQISVIMKIEHNSNFQRALFDVFGAKGKGLGGKRIGAGRLTKEKSIELNYKKDLILFIYQKENEFVFLDFSEAKNQKNTLEKSGWIYISNIKAKDFIVKLIKNMQQKRFLSVIKQLI